MRLELVLGFEGKVPVFPFLFHYPYNPYENVVGMLADIIMMTPSILGAPRGTLFQHTHTGFQQQDTFGNL